jgi:hypothetical protein
LSQAKKLSSTINKTFFLLSFAVLHFSNSGSNQHLFMLENYDVTWRNSGTEKRAFYFNVPPGQYIFRVKGSNNLGIWTEKTISIIITPPWWQTWWFWITMVIAIVFLVYIIVKS